MICLYPFVSFPSTIHDASIFLTWTSLASRDSVVLGGMDFVERGRWPHPSAQGLGLPPPYPHLFFAFCSSAPSPLHPHRPRFIDRVDLLRRLLCWSFGDLTTPESSGLLCGDFVDLFVDFVCCAMNFRVRTMNFRSVLCYCWSTCVYFRSGFCLLIRLLLPSDLYDPLLFLAVHVWSCFRSCTWCSCYFLFTLSKAPKSMMLNL